jgi:hypothetical protein
MRTEIPEKWKKAVRDILLAVDYDRIDLKLRAHQDWEATFPFSSPYYLYLAIGKELELPVVLGARKKMKEPGVACAFFFHSEGRKMYTKICLSPNGRLVIIYSAHTPYKGDTL